MVVEPDEDDVVWKIVDWQLTDIRVMNSAHKSARVRESLEMLQRLLNLVLEPLRDGFAAFAIPLDGVMQFAPGSRAQPDSRQRERTSL